MIKTRIDLPQNTRVDEVSMRQLFANYLFAKKNNGECIIRINDLKPYKDGRVFKNIEQKLNLLGLSQDEIKSKYFKQSEHNTLYKKYIDELIEKGSAYYAFDTPEELDNIREEYNAQNKTFIYNSKNREKFRNSFTLTKNEVDKLLEANTPYVIRFKVPKKEIYELKCGFDGDRSVKNFYDPFHDIIISEGNIPRFWFTDLVNNHHQEITDVIEGSVMIPIILHYNLICDILKLNKPKFYFL
ncbi:glutamate--tRNA ligase family protein [Riemerella columbina]|uniref:glutamate--tRNA ligase family protein n=1 Tax=Riemerella columbina TaxID=103810 RepID=UPI000373886A|nr:glutamate--tRNA ligase family protein [Riemerella columbina]